MRPGVVFAIFAFVAAIVLIVFSSLSIFYAIQIRNGVVLSSLQVNALLFTNAVGLALAIVVLIWAIYVWATGDRRRGGMGAEDETETETEAGTATVVASQGEAGQINANTVVITPRPGATVNDVIASAGIPPGTPIAVQGQPVVYAQAPPPAQPRVIVAQPNPCVSSVQATGIVDSNGLYRSVPGLAAPGQVTAVALPPPQAAPPMPQYPAYYATTAVPPMTR